MFTVKKKKPKNKNEHKEGPRRAMTVAEEDVLNVFKLEFHIISFLRRRTLAPAAETKLKARQYHKREQHYSFDTAPW